MDDVLARLRTEYGARGLDEDEAGADPLVLLARWLTDAIGSGMHEPNAMVLATAGSDGVLSARMVLLKGVEATGLTFFTNYESRKADDLGTSSQAALVLPWHPLQRQVRVEGPAARLTREENEAYFASRPRGSQLGAWASPQSKEVPDREFLQKRYELMAARFADTEAVPCPEHWGGYRVEPQTVEFWQGRSNRMHDRLRYRRDGKSWRRGRLAP
ncbi:MAG: pyridoxamine 5'-phosphate oxidase [Nocardioidaceae bacterium]|nr:pyridoxamine 5'-phosphate oxidase [Nocardioidaceae bacterium]